MREGGGERMMVVTLRLPPELVAELDSLVPTLDRVPDLRLFGRVSRADVVRLALREGAAVLRDRYAGQGTLPLNEER